MSTPMDFATRARHLPELGIGVSTEYGAHSPGTTLDPHALRRAHPTYGGFLEIGVEVAKGLDPAAQAWLASGAPWTYHFLDVNLDEPEDFDEVWLAELSALVTAHDPAWLCGDAGLWHIGPREPESMILLPPILTREAVAPMAAGIQRLRRHTSKEVLPENPPGSVFVGDMHLLEFFGEVCTTADTGMLLDCAHLAIYQLTQGHAPTHGLDDAILDRVVEVHIAGSTASMADGERVYEDDHGTEILPETWAIFDAVIARAPNLKAVVYECERNPLPTTLEGFQGIHARVRAAGRFGGPR